MKKLLSVVTILFLTLTCGWAEISLPGIIGSNMVLQANKPIAIWGFGDTGEKVTVSIAGQAKNAVTDQSGNWKVILDPLQTSPKPVIMTVTGTNTLTLDNILIGEVWVCSGQSNMEFPLCKFVSWRTGVFNYEQEAASANYPEIRLFMVKTHRADTPQNNCEGEWKVCTPENIRNFSAVGYYFARYLHQKIKQPVGMVQTAVGGTHAELWTKREIMANDTLYTEVFDAYSRDMAKYENYKLALSQWNAKTNNGKDTSANLPMPVKVNQPSKPACLWNGMVHPLIPLTIKGVIWYQGESNDARALKYKQVFTNLINSWRKEWGQGDFPFYFVQIAAHRDKTPVLRESQTLVWQTVKNTGMVVAADAGDSLDIHPRNKQVIGERLAFWTLAKDYGFKEITYSGPLYKSKKIIGSSIELSFDYADQGLVTNESNLKEFYIAGTDKKFHPAKAEIRNSKVLVSSPQVTSPKYVRYAWANFMRPNLYNREGLPAVPFRTDF